MPGRGWAMTAVAPVRPAGGVHTVRRVIFYLLLFVMVVIAAIGLSGLLERLLDAGNQVLADDTSALAQSLAFTLIAGPLAAILWWLVWRGLRVELDSASVAWPLYLMVATTAALITSVSALLSGIGGLVTGRWPASEFAVGVVWAAVWLWHRWMLRHKALAPTRLLGVTPSLGSLFGLIVGVAAAIAALGALLDNLAGGPSSLVVAGDPWWQPVLQSAIWAAGGALVWWWHWVHEGVRSLRTGFARVLLVIVTGAGAMAVAVFGVAGTLHVVLRMLFDPSDPVAVRLAPLGVAVAAALIGALVWQYHRGVVSAHPPVVREATRLVTSGVTLAAAATGVGVIVNALLAALGTPVADSGLASLLFAGISALVVGGPLWWVTWLPNAQRDSQVTSRPGRRVFLVAVFGVSALVALITLILIAFRLFDLGLDGASGQSALEGVRAPLGLLTATVLVAGYHFAIWRRERPSAEPMPPAPVIEQVILVAGSDPAAASAWLENTLGARVTVWLRADAEAQLTPEMLATALDGVDARRVLVVARTDGGVDVIPLAV